MPLLPPSDTFHSSSSSKSPNSSVVTISPPPPSLPRAIVPPSTRQRVGTGAPLYPRQPAKSVPLNSGRQSEVAAHAAEAQASIAATIKIRIVPPRLSCVRHPRDYLADMGHCLGGRPRIGALARRVAHI